MSFEQWARSWEAVPLAEATKLYDIGEASNELVDGPEDILGDKPECFFVHRGHPLSTGPW
ncbi:hypothetical protein [Streptomyces sp. NPDC053720]|uniref:hypothetical protein n=1 Tax=Streptomyces sp. NPDC053720 TaxID=3154855 RepID=UPI00344758D1